MASAVDPYDGIGVILSLQTYSCQIIAPSPAVIPKDLYTGEFEACDMSCEDQAEFRHMSARHLRSAEMCGKTSGRLMIVAARLQSEVMRWLHRYEFVDFERCCAGMSGWPNWHYKVLTLYAGYVAFNTLGAGLKRIVMEVHEGTAGR